VLIQEEERVLPVAQRLEALSSLLAAPSRARQDTLERCRTEVDAALDELREALQAIADGATTSHFQRAA
jgi:hypothetical protein